MRPLGGLQRPDDRKRLCVRSSTVRACSDCSKLGDYSRLFAIAACELSNADTRATFNASWSVTARECRLFGRCLSGKFAKPDISKRLHANGLTAKCRVCQVFSGRREPRRKRGHFAESTLGVRFWTPVGLQRGGWGRSAVCKSLRNLVGPPRFELGTSCTPSNKYQSLTDPPY